MPWCLNKWLFIFIVFVLLCGCYAVKGALEDIREDPVGYKEEAEQIAVIVKPALPGAIPVGAAVAVGYALAFLRRVFVNLKKKEVELEELKRTVEK